MYIHASIHMRTISIYNLLNRERVIIRVCFRIVVAFHLPEFPNTSPIPMNNYITMILEDEKSLRREHFVLCKLYMFAYHIIFTFNSIIWLSSGSHWSRNFPMQCSIACNGARTGKSSCLDTVLSFSCKEVVLVRFLEAVLSKSHHFQIAALLHRLLKFSLEFKHHTYKNLIIYHKIRWDIRTHS